MEEEQRLLSGAEEYLKKRVSAEAIQDIVRPGSSMFVESGCAEPQHLVRTLVLRNLHLSDVQVFTTIPLRTYSDFGGETGDRFRIHSFFVSPGMSGPFSAGKADHIPLSSDMLERMIREGSMRINTALVQVSPPDDDGVMSLGVTVDVVRAVMEKADVVIAQVNPRVPFTCGDSRVHISEVDYVVEHDEPLVCCGPEDLDYETRQIGEHVARLVEDGSTVQVGFGRIPDAALRAMKDRRNLSIHSEIITDTVMDLVRGGAIPEGNTITASLCIGGEELFRFVDRNPRITMASLARVSDPQAVLSKARFVAINGAVEIDLTGQSCVALGEQGAHLGALGQPHFNRIARLTTGGKAIIALRSTSRDGSISRIVPRFTESRMGVFTTQVDVGHVVTEYGSVDLFGKSIRERALELITIAHPRYRAWLLEEAKRMHYVFQDQVVPPEGACYPSRYEHMQVFGEKDVLMRPVRITDERAVQNLFYAMSADEKFLRFHVHLTSLHHRQAQHMVNCDYRNSIALVAEVEQGCSKSVVAITHICRDEDDAGGGVCEFAIMVHPAWQGVGMGSYLLRTMVDIARENGFRVFRAHVWEDNARMLRAFEKLDLHMSASVDCRVFRLDYDLAPPPDGEARHLPGGGGTGGTNVVLSPVHPLMVYAKNPL